MTRLAAVRRRTQDSIWILRARVRTGGVRTIWIGDSHAPFCLGLPLNRLQQQDEMACVWLGPKLMYSIARDGFQLGCDLRLLGAKRLVIALGEIDCRMHLAQETGQDRMHSLEWVEDYWRAVERLRAKANAFEVVQLGPVPPSDLGETSAEYPRRGTLADRARSTEVLTQKLSVTAPAWALVMNLQHILGHHDGTLDPAMTDDGIHINQAGRQALQASLRSVAGDCQSAQSG